MRQPSGVWKIGLVVGFSFVAYLLAGQIALGQSRVSSVDLSYLGYQQGGGGCRTRVLYDQQGNAHEELFWHVEYVGPAPLYEPDTSIKPTLPPDNGCPIYPAKIPPDLAIKGNTVYPLHFNVREAANRKNILAGESFVLITMAQFTDYFEVNDLAIPITPQEYETISLSLEAPSFNFEPSNETIRPMAVMMQSVAEQRWVLFPKEAASGDQTVIMYVRTDWLNAAWFYQLDLKVEKVYGIDPRTAGVGAFLLTAIGGFIAFSLGNINSFLNIRKTYEEIKQAELQKSNNKRKRSKK